MTVNIKDMIGKIYNYLIKSLEIFCAILMFVMIVLVTIGVFNRYVLRQPIAWVVEIVRFSLVWISLIGACIALEKNEHVAVSYFYDKMPAKIKYILTIVNIIVIGYFAYIMIVSGYEFSITIFRGTFTGISGRVPRTAIPVSGTLMSIILFKKLMILFANSREE